MRTFSRICVFHAFFIGILIGSLERSHGQSQGFFGKEHVGRLSTNQFYTPVNQVLTPAGLQVELPGLRPQALALSPDRKWLITSGKSHELVVIDPVSGKILQHVQLPPRRNDEAAPESVS